MEVEQGATQSRENARHDGLERDTPQVAKDGHRVQAR